LEISSKLLEGLDLRMEAKRYLKELEAHTNEVIHLVVYNQREAVYIEKLEGNETLRMHSRVGARAPLHCTSVGKVILAFLPVEEVEEVLRDYSFHAHTPHTITVKEELLQHLQEVRQKGFALDLEENELGINCIAAPIFDHQGHIVAAISVSGPVIRMTPQRLEELQGLMMEISRKISSRLGYNSY
jgi:DNA-binding IclR family transcriptional regulator